MTVRFELETLEHPVLAHRSFHLFAVGATQLRFDLAGDAFVACSGETTVKLARSTNEGWQIEVVDRTANNLGTRFGERRAPRSRLLVTDFRRRHELLRPL